MRKRGKANEVVVRGRYDGPNEDVADSSKLRPYTVEVRELERVVRIATGRTLFLSVRQNAIANDQDNAAGTTDTMVIKAFGHVVVGRRQALQFIKDAYDERLRAVARAKLTISNSCLFIG